MPYKKYKDRNIRKLTKIGEASLGLTLSKDIIVKSKLRERQKVRVFLKGRTIMIQDWRKSIEVLRDRGRKWTVFDCLFLDMLCYSCRQTDLFNNIGLKRFLFFCP